MKDNSMYIYNLVFNMNLYYKALIEMQASNECYLDSVKEYNIKSVKSYNTKSKVKKLSLSYNKVDSTRKK